VRAQAGPIWVLPLSVVILKEGVAMRAGELTAEFGIAGILEFADEGGLTKATVVLDGMVGQVYMQGAQLTTWQPRGRRPVLFTSPNSTFAPGRAIRGGIPIIFPWFGPNRRTPAAPQHGFARTAAWRLDAIESAGSRALTLTFGLSHRDVRSAIWPEPFHAIYRVVFAPTLRLHLTIQNQARHPIAFEEALHNYFAISDIEQVAISGLAGTTFIDKTSAGQRKQQSAPLVAIAAETDSVYLDTPPQCAIEDRGWQQRVIVEKAGAASTVVWNPWAEKAAAMADLGASAWRGMVCVETGNVADNEVRLAADAEHQMSTAISVSDAS
jgi:glucose-6-phosphate 1-epimerase